MQQRGGQLALPLTAVRRRLCDVRWEDARQFDGEVELHPIGTDGVGEFRPMHTVGEVPRLQPPLYHLGRPEDAPQWVLPRRARERRAAVLAAAHAQKPPGPRLVQLNEGCCAAVDRRQRAQAWVDNYLGASGGPTRRDGGGDTKALGKAGLHSPHKPKAPPAQMDGGLWRLGLLVLGARPSDGGPPRQQAHDLRGFVHPSALPHLTRRRGTAPQRRCNVHGMQGQAGPHGRGRGWCGPRQR